ncbi:MAG: TA system VapC family ribonuclease toxin [Bryobacteraceae bacterium]
MRSLSFPDVNVWLALLLGDHVHRAAATEWWRRDESEVIGFTRLTQLGVLRLLTTAAAMNGRPLTMPAAWDAYDQLFADDRVAFVEEPEEVEPVFRKHASEARASAKLWADAWLLALAERSDANVVTFDRGLASRSGRCLLLS